MKIVYNRFIPFKGFLAINLFGVMFVRKEYEQYLQTSDKMKITINHESIHTEQMKELWYLGFYVLYLLEWFWNLLRYGFNLDKAYRNISFEREAYKYERDLNYLKTRKKFAQFKRAG